MKLRLSFVNLKELVKKQPILNSIDLNLCTGCKATQLQCGLNYCPLLKALDLYPDSITVETIQSDGTLFGPSPQIFVGSQGYPQVLSGPMTLIQADANEARLASNPALWVDMDFKEIIRHRFGLLRGKKPVHVTPGKEKSSTPEKLVQVTLSTQPVEIEGQFDSLTNFNFRVQPGSQPLGPSADLKRFDLTSNPQIPRKVDSIVHDELTAAEQLLELYRSKYDVYYLQGILSSGTLGKEVDARIVPTRWAITGVDDTLGKDLEKSIRYFPLVDQIEVRQGSLLGNYYTVIFIPGDFSFENIEAWFPGNIFSLRSTTPSFSINREGFGRKLHSGRKSYATQAGGYYASRLSVLKQLVSMKKQAKVVVIREITPEYIIPVGVWQVREGVRLTMNNPSIVFETKRECIEYLQDRTQADINQYLPSIRSFSMQNIDDYF